MIRNPGGFAWRRQYRCKVHPCTAQPLVGITLKAVVGEEAIPNGNHGWRLKRKMPPFAAVGNRVTMKSSLFETLATSLATRCRRSSRSRFNGGNLSGAVARCRCLRAVLSRRIH